MPVDRCRAVKRRTELFASGGQGINTTTRYFRSVWLPVGSATQFVEPLPWTGSPKFTHALVVDSALNCAWYDLSQSVFQQISTCETWIVTMGGPLAVQIREASAPSG